MRALCLCVCCPWQALPLPTDVVVSLYSAHLPDIFAFPPFPFSLVFPLPSKFLFFSLLSAFIASSGEPALYALSLTLTCDI